MRWIFLLLLTIFMKGQDSYAQSFESSKDAENGSLVMKGAISFEDLKTEASFEWFGRNAAYTPDAQALALLKKDLAAYDIVVVMGTWCEDSQNLVPKLYTVLQQAGYPMDKLDLYGVDRTKDALNGEKGKYAIERVPTIIFYREGKEAGRITESVQESVERDIANILHP